MHPFDLSPRLVRSLLTVLRMQSHTRAAKALNLTQPAVTKHISRLEEYLGFRLLQRSRGVVLPTPGCEAMLADFERLENSLDAICDKARGVVTGGHNAIQIATPTSMVAQFLAPAITRMRREGASIYPVIREVDDHRVYDMVRDGSVDLALTSMTGNDSDLSCRFLFRDRPCLVCPIDHPLASREALSPADLLPFDLIRPPANTHSNRLIGIFERALDTRFSFSAEVSRLMTMEVMARNGLGLLVLPALSARLAAHSGLCSVPIDSNDGWRECQLILQRHVHQSALQSQIVDRIRETVREAETRMPGLLSTKAS